MKRLCYFVLMVVLIFQSAVFNSFAAEREVISITSFTASPKKAAPAQKINFRVKTNVSAESVYMTVDGEGKYNFTKKSQNLWQLERKFTVIGKRYIKVYAVDGNGNRDSISDTIEIAAPSDVKEEKVTETTTERVYTGNVSRDETTETTTEEIVIGGDDFDGRDSYEASLVKDNYFTLSDYEDMDVLDEIAERSVFVEIGQNYFYDKWQKKPIDDTNSNVVPYIENDYTLIPLRAVSEALGAYVEWDENTKTALLSISGNKIAVTVNAPVMRVGGADIALDVPARISQDRVFVPLRAVCEAFNKNVYYKDKFIGIVEKRFQLTDNGLILIKDAIERSIF